MKIKTPLLALLIFALVTPAFNQQCYPAGFQVKGDPWAANDTISATACVFNGAPAGVVGVAHGDMFNFIFDSQLGTVASVPAHPTVNHATGWTSPASPIDSGDFNVMISPNNPSKIVIQFQPASTHQMAVGDSITVAFTFNTGNAVTAPVTFYSSITGFGQNLPSNVIIVQ